jgi:hypothetical protein
MVQPADAPQPEPPRPESRLPSVRVGDAEREEVVARLQAALAEGRLELHEFEERSTAAYAAKTEQELLPLTADLPANVGLTPKTPAVPSTAEVTAQRRRRLLTGAELGWVRTAVILTAIWAVSSVAAHQLTPFWPIFPIGIWGAVLLAQRLTGGHRR